MKYYSNKLTWDTKVQTYIRHLTDTNWNVEKKSQFKNYTKKYQQQKKVQTRNWFSLRVLQEYCNMLNILVFVFKFFVCNMLSHFDVLYICMHEINIIYLYKLSNCRSFFCCSYIFLLLSCCTLSRIKQKLLSWMINDPFGILCFAGMFFYAKLHSSFVFFASCHAASLTSRGQ